MCSLAGAMANTDNTHLNEPYSAVPLVQHQMFIWVWLRVLFLWVFCVEGFFLILNCWTIHILGELGEILRLGV